MSKTPEQPTLRDQFAIAALQGILAGFKKEALNDTGAIAEAAYAFADAMLEARK